MKNGVVSTSRTELATEVYESDAIQRAKCIARAAPAMNNRRHSRIESTLSSPIGPAKTSGASKTVAQKTL